MRLLPVFALCAAVPFLVAGVRMQTGADAIFLAPLEKPDPAAQRLPAAGGLEAPEVMTVSTTDSLPQAQPSPTQPAQTQATQAASPTQPQPQPAQADDSNQINQLSAELCLKAMTTTAGLAMLSYQQDPRPISLHMALAATAAQAQIADGQWPALTAFDNLRDQFPMDAPQQQEIRTTAKAAHDLCRSGRTKLVKGSRVKIDRPD